MKKIIDKENNYWDKFYEKKLSIEPSQFCLSVIPKIEKNTNIVEFGTGNGQDAFYFASKGFNTVGIDLSKIAIQNCLLRKESNLIKNIDFYIGDISNENSILEGLTYARNFNGSDTAKIIVYCRFVIHTLDLEQEQIFLSALSNFLEKNDKVFFEFRSLQDIETDKHFGNDNHFRRYVDSEIFANNIKNIFNFSIDYFETSKGFAKYNNEDPIITRMHITKN